MASSEEKIVALMAVSENLRKTAVEQQKEVADTLALARETLKGYREVSENAVKTLQTETSNISLRVRNAISAEVKKLDIAEALQGRLDAHFNEIEAAVQRLEISANTQADNFNARAKEVSGKINRTTDKMGEVFWYYLIGLLFFAAIVITFSVMVTKTAIEYVDDGLNQLREEIHQTNTLNKPDVSPNKETPAKKKKQATER